MGIEYESVVDHPLAEVFAWHTRPGAMTRLVHDPSAFDPPHRFVDVLSSEGPMSWPARVIGWWRHTHEFREVPSGTRVCDHVDTSVPAAALRSTFVYRHR
jgi:ligand-binding SRPBCC domain-containing protein